MAEYWLDVTADEANEALKYIRDEMNKKPIEKVLLYYGWPNAINGSWDVNNSANIYKEYDICIFGDGYELPDHEAHEDTVAIFAKLVADAPDTRLVGYVPIGALEENEESNLSIEEIKYRIDCWYDIGANGIFLDEYGYDYMVTRARQNEIVSYCKSLGLFVFANSWSLDYVFSTEAITVEWLEGFEPNPDCLPCLLDENDYYLYENLFYTATQGTDETYTIECSSPWRLDDVVGYFTRAVVDGLSYYEKYHTKLCSLDAIPSSLSSYQQGVLESISVVGASILNIHALALGDENWGADGNFRQWDLPQLDLSRDGIHSVSSEIRTYTDADGNEQSFPYTWSALMNSVRYTVVFDIPTDDYTAWVDGERYVMVGDSIVENLWMTVFDFQPYVRTAQEQAQEAVDIATEIKESVSTVLPDLESAKTEMNETIAAAKTELDTVITSAKTELSSARDEVDAALADVQVLVSGFGFKEVQW